MITANDLVAFAEKKLLVERENLRWKDTEELVDIVLNYQAADFIRKQHNELCRTVVFCFNALTAEDVTELSILGYSVFHNITYSLYSDHYNENQIVKFHCDCRIDAERLYDKIGAWALDSDILVNTSSIE